MIAPGPLLSRGDLEAVCNEDHLEAQLTRRISGLGSDFGMRAHFVFTFQAAYADRDAYENQKNPSDLRCEYLRHLLDEPDPAIFAGRVRDAIEQTENAFQEAKWDPAKARMILVDRPRLNQAA